MIQEVLYKLQLRDFEEHSVSGDNVVHVSALVQCPLKWFFAAKYPELARAQQFQGYMILGKLVHLGLQGTVEKFMSEFGFRRVSVEVPLEKRINVDGPANLPTIITVKGRADILAETFDGEKVIVEIKTARGDYNMPSPHHVLQLRTYMNMANISKGILLYITPDRIAEYTVNNPLSDHELQKLITEFMQRKAPRYDWECQYYCPYAVLCPYKKTNRR